MEKMKKSKKKPTVTVLMSTYNGSKFLKEQIESILSQIGVNVSILVRDDGSSDETTRILKKYENEGKLKWYSGKNLGPAKSFLNLVNANINSEFCAFSDQDDVWKKDKLKRAIYKLNKYDANIPLLYTSNFELVDESLNPLPNVFHLTTTTLNSAIVCSLCTGCTMVFNQELLKKLKGKIPNSIFMHDDWIHKVCLSIGGIVIYDKNFRGVYYRQHKNNVEGGRHTIFEKIKIYKKRVFDQRYCMLNEWKEILNLYNLQIPLKNKKVINTIINYPAENIFERIKLVKNPDYKIKYKRLAKEFELGIIFKFY